MEIIINSHNLRISSFVSPLLESNSFVVEDNNEVLVVDPSNSDELINYLKIKVKSKLSVILTHEHLDHTLGIPILKDLFNIFVISNDYCSKILEKGNLENRRLVSIMLSMQSKDSDLARNRFDSSFKDWNYVVDFSFCDYCEFFWNSHKIQLRSSPGHSYGSILILFDNFLLFSGDTLLLHFPTITRLPGGNTKDFFKYTIPYIQTLNDELFVLPGHYECFKLKEAINRYKNV